MAVAVEHDSEKLNVALAANLGLGFRARVAMLDLGGFSGAENVGFGVGWFRAL
jgi:hypothetical protein